MSKLVVVLSCLKASNSCLPCFHTCIKLYFLIKTHTHSHMTYIPGVYNSYITDDSSPSISSYYLKFLHLSPPAAPGDLPAY